MQTARKSISFMLYKNTHRFLVLQSLNSLQDTQTVHLLSAHGTFNEVCIPVGSYPAQPLADMFTAVPSQPPLWQTMSQQSNRDLTAIHSFRNTLFSYTSGLTYSTQGRH